LPKLYHYEKKENGKNNTGRPSKLTKKFIEATKEVLNSDINCIIYTDEELVNQINERLPKKQQICVDTLVNWKESKKKNQIDSRGRQFFRLYKKSLQNQKNLLFKKFRNEPVHWQRWAWILERKFGEWNIRQRFEHTGEYGRPIEVHITNYTEKDADKDAEKEAKSENTDSV